jgi:hypothetical protein
MLLCSVFFQALLWNCFLHNRYELVSKCGMSLRTLFASAFISNVAQVHVWVLADCDHLLHVYIGADLHISV